MRYVLGIMLVGLCSCASVRVQEAAEQTPDELQQYVSTLVTPGFRITLTDTRQEGEVTSDHVTCRLARRGSDNSILLKGSTKHAVDDEGTPTHFQGWQFQEGNVYCFVSQEGHVEIVLGDSVVLVDEDGTWQEDEKKVAY